MNLVELKQICRTWTGNGEEFDRMLRENKVPFISYRMISSLEFCKAKYYLEYVKRVKLDPEPAYFIKGRAFHEAAAVAYSALKAGSEVDRDEVFEALKQLESEDEKTRLHLANAVQLMLDELVRDREVVAVEQPFAMLISDELPVFVGIIDLICRSGKNYIIIDHKTGRTFSEPDEFQMIIYLEFVRREYHPTSVQAAWHQYRWVNNLTRIRKPAFQTLQLNEPDDSWSHAKQRIASAWTTMNELEKGKGIFGNGNCFACPFRPVCPYA